MHTPLRKHVCVGALALAVLVPGGVWAQDTAEAATAEAATEDAAPIAPDIQTRLEAALAELARVREEIAAESVPMTEQLNTLERGLIDAREEYSDVKRQFDRRNLDINNLKQEIKGREDERGYLENLLAEYIRNLETRLHICELNQYVENIREAQRAPDNPNLSQAARFKVQTDLVERSINRLDEMRGGMKFKGSAAGEDGLVKQGHFIHFGPLAFFSADDGTLAGIAEQRIGSLEPAVLGFADPAEYDVVRAFVANGGGIMPFDASLGNARKVEETRETVGDEIAKGGIMMYPILGVAALTMAYGVMKLLSLMFMSMRLPSKRLLNRFMRGIAKPDHAEIGDAADKARGPAGAMLKAAYAHINERKELIEEVMFETVLKTRHKIRGMIPFVAVSAAAAPLMGLLGTVMGIIDTFKMLTVFGSGDVKALSGGISVALITTKYGLILAIPALVFHAILSSLTRGYTERMERTAIAVLGEVERARIKQEEEKKQRAVSNEAEGTDAKQEAKGS